MAFWQTAGYLTQRKPLYFSCSQPLAPWCISIIAFVSLVGFSFEVAYGIRRDVNLAHEILCLLAHPPAKSAAPDSGPAALTDALES